MNYTTVWTGLQQKLYDEMLARLQQTDIDVPYLERGFYYYTRTEEGKQYPIHCRKKGSLEAPEEVILDVNQLAEGKPFMAVRWRTVSPDGNLLAYHTDETGFRQLTLQVGRQERPEPSWPAISRQAGPLDKKPPCRRCLWTPSRSRAPASGSTLKEPSTHQQ